MTPLHPLVASLAALASALLAAGTALSAHTVDVPAPLAPAAHEALAMQVGARGVQIYECRVGADGAAWAFVAPEAELFDRDGRRVGTHGAGPHWRFADGREVGGRVKARVDAPRPDAIPWLLLEAQDRLARLRSIQRINTAGGQPPAAGCDPARTGDRVRVPYTADYLFYGSR